MAGTPVLRRTLGAGDGVLGRRGGSPGNGRGAIRTSLVGASARLPTRRARAYAVRLQYRPDVFRIGPVDLPSGMERLAGRPNRRGLCRRGTGLLQPIRASPGGWRGTVGRAVSSP